MLVLDSGAVTRLAGRNQHSLALIQALRRADLWPPVVPTMVLVESLEGGARDANTNRFLKSCLIRSDVPMSIARRAAELRHLARAGSAVDALVVAMAEPGGVVLTGDKADIEALSAHAQAVSVEVV